MAKSTAFRKRRKQQLLKKQRSGRKGLSLFFYGLWGKKVLGVLFSPTKSWVRLAILGVSLWLGVGAVVFGASYLAYRRSSAHLAQQRTQIEREGQVWQHILTTHPTSREALWGAYSAAVRLGKDEDAGRFLELLERIDPNDPRVKQQTASLKQD